MTVLTLSEGDYVEVGAFRGKDRIISLTFPDLQLTPEQIFAAAA